MFDKKQRFFVYRLQPHERELHPYYINTRPNSPRGILPLVTTPIVPLDCDMYHVPLPLPYQCYIDEVRFYSPDTKDRNFAMGVSIEKCLGGEWELELARDSDKSFLPAVFNEVPGQPVWFKFSLPGYDYLTPTQSHVRMEPRRHNGIDYKILLCTMAEHFMKLMNSIDSAEVEVMEGLIARNAGLIGTNPLWRFGLTGHFDAQNTYIYGIKKIQQGIWQIELAVQRECAFREDPVGFLEKQNTKEYEDDRKKIAKQAVEWCQEFEKSSFSDY